MALLPNYSTLSASKNSSLSRKSAFVKSQSHFFQLTPNVVSSSDVFPNAKELRRHDRKRCMLCPRHLQQLEHQIGEHRIITRMKDCISYAGYFFRDLTYTTTITTSDMSFTYNISYHNIKIIREFPLTSFDWSYYVGNVIRRQTAYIGNMKLYD